MQFIIWITEILTGLGLLLNMLACVEMEEKDPIARTSAIIVITQATGNFCEGLMSAKKKIAEENAIVVDSKAILKEIAKLLDHGHQEIHLKIKAYPETIKNQVQ